ncbi:MAG: hypothetical protein AMXMBFR58_14400 [Phycisphaerae bacterium]
MPIEAKLTITPTDLLVQQNPSCELTLTNAGPGDIAIPTPLDHPAVLGMRVTEISTGIEVQRWREAGLKPPASRPVKAGNTVTGYFGLIPVSHIHAPGTFEVSALVRIKLDLIESNRVRLTLAPVTPRSHAAVTVNGGHSTIRYSVSINRAADPPRLVRHRIEAVNEGGATNAWNMAEVPPDVAPQISSCANRSVTHAHWVAWIEGENLRAQHIAADGTLTRPESVRVPSKDSRLVAPLSIDPDGTPDNPMPGRALLWTPGVAGGTLTPVTFAPGAKPQLGEPRPLDGSPPVWLQTFERSDRTAWVIRAAKTEGGQLLQVLPWPGSVNAAATPKKIGVFDGDFLAGTVVLDDADTLHVAVLVMVDPARTRQVRLLTWRCAAMDQPVAADPLDIPWPADEPVAKAIVRFDPRNIPNALISNGVSWHFYDARRELKPAPAVLNTASTVDLVFFKASPAFLLGKPMFGFDIIQSDGSPLPHRCG